jgi:hypothetical protein
VSYKFNYELIIIVPSGCHVSYHYSSYGASHIWNSKKILEG